MSVDEPTGPTLDELLENLRRAGFAYERSCVRVVNLAGSILQARGLLALPPPLVQAVDAADDARAAWLRAVDDVRRSQS